MKYFWKAAKFALHCQLPTPPKVAEEEITVKTDQFEIPAILYTPKGKSCGTILAVNGLAYLGNKDPRFAAVCRSAAAVGYTVISPLLVEVTQFRIRKETVEKIKDLILHISSDKKYCPDQKLSYIAPSFSGSMGLIAASDPEVGKKISSILTIGAYCDVQSTLDYVMTSDEGDEYGRMILLYNFVKYALKSENQELEFALKACVLDGSFSRETLELPTVLENISAENKEVFFKLREDKSFREKIWKEIVANAGSQSSFLQELQVKDKLHLLDCHVSIVHGLGDNVVPAKEAVILKENLPRKKSKLVLTPLISHGDVGISLAQLPAIYDLVQGFAFFFKNAKVKEKKAA
ncbi:alpha/beta hydrolase [Leptospira selangorensis]|uniref:Alpha/beta hydrolase n=1 Tax=Leptospira selangorensis TaxID=2484982 RepID=A0A4R9G9D6_9LEPT|nr:alpha/beta hydrolase [Leptospira selangorensis]TGK08336.1 alpha/beta hydrolase [Leptospira selangorensis]TGM15631.1 alpha/beta hydrolase [Leptospira selangorensis]TGM18419.1 alpha/beta hydrolase [Leptospira selangorensis]